MATARLVPSTYSVSNNTVTVSNASNMYTNVDSTNYATITHTTSGTTSYYLYLKGFNFSDIPDSAVVSSFTVKVRGYESGLSTSTSYAPRLYNGTSTITGGSAASSNFGTSASTITVPYTGQWSTLKGYGSNLGIRLVIRRSSRNTQGYLYIYGAEIDVTYTVPNPRTVTSTLSGSGTISPSGATTTYDGETYTLTITPTNKNDTITVTNGGTDVTSSLEGRYNGTPSGTQTSVSSVPGSSYETGFSTNDSNFYQNSSTTSTSWLQYAIGHSAESPYSTSNTSNTYVKSSSQGSSSTATGWFGYSFDFSSIPENAYIVSVEVKCYGARESSSTGSQYVARMGCYCNGILKGAEEEFTSTSNGIKTLSNPGTWTRSELQHAQLRFTVGYYGGRMLGITWKVTYVVPTSGPDYYTYSYVVNGDTTIAVVIGAGATNVIYFKNNGAWVAATAVYKKVNGSWVSQSDLTSVFDSNTNYVRG